MFCAGSLPLRLCFAEGTRTWEQIEIRGFPEGHDARSCHLEQWNAGTCACVQAGGDDSGERGVGNRRLVPKARSMPPPEHRRAFIALCRAASRSRFFSRRSCRCRRWWWTRTVPSTRPPIPTVRFTASSTSRRRRQGRLKDDKIERRREWKSSVYFDPGSEVHLGPGAR